MAVGKIKLGADDLSAAILPFSGKILTSRTLQRHADKQKYNFVLAINIPNWLAVCNASQMAHHCVSVRLSVRQYSVDKCISVY
jgi:hypothetical protein